MEEIVGKKVIARGDRSGVFFGTVKSVRKTTIVLKNVQQLWYWAGALNTTELSVNGTSKPTDCKFSVPAKEGIVLDAIVIYPCTEEAIKSLEAVKPVEYGS